MLAEKIKEMAYEAGEKNNCRLYDIYRHRDRVQVFIDKPSCKEGVSLKDCENVFHSLSQLMNQEFPEVLKTKRLEISSPGLNKRLREVWHFKESVGQTVKVTFNQLIKGENPLTGKSASSQFAKGTLVSFEEDVLNIQQGDLTWKFALSDVKTAEVVFALEGNFKNNKKSKGKK